MKYIDMENWKRKEHFNYFSRLDYPHFNICGNLDATAFYRYVKGNGLPFFVSVVYTASKTANGINEFKLRIRDGKVVEHEAVSPSFTVMGENEVFGFCTVNFIKSFNEFKAAALEEIEKVKSSTSLKDEPGRDDLLYITSIPWVSFTGITHPVHMNPVDSIPRISWGKYFEEAGKIKLPLSVQVHHALVDGMHVGQYFSTFQEILNSPGKNL